MKFDLVKDEMTLLLENLNEQFETIKDHESKIPQIEVDIFMRNIQKLYENAVYLNKMNEKNNDSAILIIKEDTDKIEAEVVLEEEVKEEVTNQIDIVDVKDEKTESKEQEIVEDSKIEETSINNIEESIEEPVNVSKPIAIKEELTEQQEEKIEELVEPTLSFDDMLEEEQQESDLFTNIKTNNEISDLNKKLADARNTQSIVEKLQNKRIESLKSVIGINDKFYFINELFKGNSQKYEDIIYTLNNFKKLEDAMVYFSTLKYKFSWDEESEAYVRLTHMLERKFEMANA